MSIGSNIKLLREQNNLSQEELGKIAGVSDKAVSTWENDIKIPRMGAIQRIADYFGIRKSDIIEDKQSIGLTLTKHQIKVIQAYINHPEMQSAVDKLLGIESDT